MTAIHVDRFSCRCGNCGKSCSYEEYSHETVLGYGPENGSKGCGEVFTHLVSDYVGPNWREETQRLRPDLPIEDVYHIDS